MARAGRVSLGIYDVLGRRVAAPLTGQLRPAGRQEVRFEPGSLPPGLYVARLETSGQAVTKQLIIAQ